jgi:hypothetical protein
MTPVIAIAVFVVAVGLIAWNAGVMRRFKRDYRFNGEFHGKRYECVLRFANLESGIWCFLGADTSALYLLIATERKRHWWMGNRVGLANQIFSTDLQIPWSDLAWREKRNLLKDCIWFEIPASKIYFYVPRNVGDNLLFDGGRKTQSEFDVVFQSKNTTRP